MDTTNFIGITEQLPLTIIYVYVDKSEKLQWSELP